MTQTSGILPWLEHLRVLMPPRHVTLVGAGGGSSAWVQWLQQADLPSATLIEADERQAAMLQEIADGQQGWRVREQVVAPQTGTVPFHVASVPSESGLLIPEDLRTLWPNLKTRRTQSRQAVSLEEVLQDDEIAPNWLMVDCLPAARLLLSAARQLSEVDVLVLRMQFGPGGDSEDLEELQRVPVESPFRLIFAEPGRHPRLGHALVVRDHGAARESLRRQLAASEMAASAAQAAAAKEHAAHVGRLEQALAEAAKLAAERHEQVQGLQARLQQLQQTSADLDARLQQVLIEQTRAEARLDLMKEVVLKEPRV